MGRRLTDMFGPAKASFVGQRRYHAMPRQDIQLSGWKAHERIVRMRDDVFCRQLPVPWIARRDKPLLA